MLARHVQRPSHQRTLFLSPSLKLPPPRALPPPLSLAQLAQFNYLINNATLIKRSTCRILPAKFLASRCARSCVTSLLNARVSHFSVVCIAAISAHHVQISNIRLDR